MKRIITCLCLSLVICALAMLVGCDKGAKATLCGVALQEYTIVYSAEENDYNERAAKYLQGELLARCGVEVPVVTDSETSGTGYEILVGETSRTLSQEFAPEISGVEFAFLAKEGSVAMEADAFVIAGAVYYFIDTYFPTKDAQAIVPEEVTVATPIVKEAKNFILLIGDGMGVFQTKMPEIYEAECDFSDGYDVR